jgi:hypothetical protein
VDRGGGRRGHALVLEWVGPLGTGGPQYAPRGPAVGLPQEPRQALEQVREAQGAMHRRGMAHGAVRGENLAWDPVTRPSCWIWAMPQCGGAPAGGGGERGGVRGRLRAECRTDLHWSCSASRSWWTPTRRRGRGRRPTWCAEGGRRLYGQRVSNLLSICVVLNSSL